MDAPNATKSLKVVRAGIDTYQQPVVYMHRDSEICRSEGFAAHTRVEMRIGDHTLVATLNVVVGHMVALDEVALSGGGVGSREPDAGRPRQFPPCGIRRLDIRIAVQGVWRRARRAART